MEHGISWYRPDGKKVVVCSEKTQQCLHAPGFEGKYAGVMSTVVDYVLKIIQFEPDIDSGTWSCSDGDLGPKSSCDKAIGCKLRNAFILYYCIRKVSEPVLHDWCNKGRGMCYPVCGMGHIKEPLLLIDKSSLCGGSGFPISLSEWSLTICLTPYNCR